MTLDIIHQDGRHCIA